MLAFPALGTGYKISRAWHWYWLHVIPRLALVTCFPAHDTSYVFPALDTGWMFYEFCLTFWLALYSIALVVIGFSVTKANLLRSFHSCKYSVLPSSLVLRFFMISCSFYSNWWSAKCNTSFQQGPKGTGKFLQRAFKLWISHGIKRWLAVKRKECFRALDLKFRGPWFKSSTLLLLSGFALAGKFRDQLLDRVV